MLKFFKHYLFTLAESILLYWIIDSLLTCRFTGYKKAVFLGAAIICESLFVQFCPEMTFFLKPLVFTALSFVIVQILYEDDILIKIFFILLSNYIFLINDIIAGNFSSLLIKTNIEGIIHNISNSTLLFYIISKINTFLMAGMCIYFFKRISINISSKYWIVMDLIIVFFIVTINFLMSINSILQAENSFYSVYIIRISVSFLLMSILTIYLFGEICLFYQRNRERYALETRNKVLESQLALQGAYTLNLKKMRHDIKNNLSNISYLIKENHIEESVKYINAITSDLEATKSVIHCGNKYFDSILNYEISLCKNNNIDVRFEIDNIPELSIKPTDLSSVFSNILNNAVEANLKLPESERYLSLKIFCYKNYLTGIVKNPYDHTITENHGGILVTDKKDKLNHGYGLKSIKSSVESYGGIFKYSYENNIFTSIVLMPINPVS